MADGATKKAGATAAREHLRYTPLMIVLAAASLGIIADRLCSFSVWIWFSAGTLSLFAWWAARRFGWTKTASTLVLLAAAGTAAGWHHCRWSLFDKNDLGFFSAVQTQNAETATPVCLRAVVAEEPSRAPAPPYDPMRIMPQIDRSRLELRVRELRDADRWRPASGRATLLVDGHVLGVHAGDRVEVLASLSHPRPPCNPGQYDRAAYLRADGRLATLYASRPECVTLLETPAPSVPGELFASLLRLPDRARSAGRRILQKYLDRQTQGLATALLLGSREEVGREEYAAFVETGAVHILAVSGLHVGILAVLLFFMARLFRLSRRRELLIVAVATVAFAFLTGGRPPVVRATVLVLMLCLSYSLARRPSPYNSLAAAGLVVLILNPADLFRLGAQLSFLAVAAIMFFTPRNVSPRRVDNLPDHFDQTDPLDIVLREKESTIKKSFRKAFYWYWQGVLLSLVIWLVAAPLVMARFHIVSPGSVLLTPLLVPFVGLALFSGLIVLAFGWLLPPVAAFAAVICNWSLMAIQYMVDTAHDLPASHFWVCGPADWWLAGFYVALAVAAIVPNFRFKRPCFAALLLIWIAAGFAVSHAKRQDRSLACTFLSVGHGCATVVELPDGRTLLYDVGEFSSPEWCAKTVANCLWSRGISHLDAVVISHADADHYNGLPRLLDMISVGAVYVSPGTLDSPRKSICYLKKSLEKAGVPIRNLAAGGRLDREISCVEREDDENYRIEVLHPDEKYLAEEAKQKKHKQHDNARSMVLLIEYQGRSIILPGDLEPPGLDALLARRPVDCDVLLVPHHGSRNSNPPGLSAWCRPEIAVISGSLSHNYAETEKAYRTTGDVSQPVRTLHTGRDGAVRIEICDGDITTQYN